MDGSRAAAGVMQGGAYGGGGGIDLQGPLQIDHPQHPNPGFHHHHAHQLQQQQQHHQQQQQQQQQQYLSQQTGLNSSHPQTHDMFPQSASKDIQEQPPPPPQQQQPHQHPHHVHHHHHQQQGYLPPENRKIERMPSISEEDDLSLTTEGGGTDIAGPEGGGKGGKKGSAASQWHRMKWTGSMVKLLITIVSYIGEDASGADFPGGGCGGGGRRKFPTLQKKGKWKSVSKVMAERGYYVSPQQCEDKFNDLNKRYKRLNDILGRGISCEVVENPALLDRLDHVSEKGKEDVRKILSSKHLFYEEMCSYHNGNRLHLPADPEVQRMLQVALQSRDEQDARRTSQDDSDDDDQGGDSDDDDDVVEEHHHTRDDTGGSFFTKRMKRSNGELAEYTSAPQDGNRSLCAPGGFSVDMNQVFSETPMDEQPQRQMMASYHVQLQEQQLQIQAEMMELERQRFKWQRFSKKKDRELEKMRLENERMKLDNERLSLELKRRELELRNH